MFKKFITFFNKLSSRPKVGGLQITDLSIQYLLLEGEKIKNFNFKLAPGVIRQGKLENSEEFAKALQQLHEMIMPGRANAIVKAIVVLPGEAVYTQSFSIPNIDQARLEEASLLNLQTISPIPPNLAYMSSQVISENPDSYGLLGAFVEKGLTDEYHRLLAAGHFEPVVFEFPALALSRVVGKVVGLAKEAILVVQISSDGLDLFLFRNQSIHFDYFRSWQSIQGDAREIPRQVFEEVVVEEVKKVINFALSHFRETPKQALLVMPGLETEVKGILEKGFALAAVPLVAGNYPLSPNWYVVLGAALRGTLNPSQDNFIALGTGEGGFDVFYEDQVLNFIRLWRNILTGVLGFFLVVFGVSAFYLAQKTNSFKENLANISVRYSGTDLQDVENKVKDFNGLVTAASQVRSGSASWQVFFQKLFSLAAANQVTLDQLSIPSLAGQISIVASAPDHDTILRFKNALAARPDFQNVDLPLANIVTQPDNSVDFTINFNYASSTP